jgi:hypothetical protein
VVKILIFLDLVKTISFLDGHYLYVCRCQGLKDPEIYDETRGVSALEGEKAEHQQKLSEIRESRTQDRRW